MAKVKTTRWTLLLALFATASNGAEVYRSTDANGVPTFSDRPGENSETVYVATPRAGRPGNAVAARPAAPQPNATQPGTRQAAAPGAQQPAQPAQPVPPSPTEVAANRANNCNVARERQNKFTVAHRIYREGANGTREYLTAEQMDEAKAKAAADVATWCD
jgi:hypothetical protein